MSIFIILVALYICFELNAIFSQIYRTNELIGYILNMLDKRGE